jgi:hypothetical protein
MSQSLSKNLRRRGALPALITALGVLAWLIVIRAVEALTWLVSYIVPQPGIGTNGLFGLSRDYGPIAFGELASSIGFSALPFAFGVFVSLWIIAPVAGELEMRFVIARAVLAAGCGAVLSILGGFIEFLGDYFTYGTWGYGNLPGVAGEVWMNFVYGIAGGISNFFVTLPLVMLGIGFLWLWLRNRDPKHPVYGILDEV